MEYEHIIYLQVKDGKNHICIDRLFSNGRRDFMTHIELDNSEGEEEGFNLMDKAADWLGHSLLIDSIPFRKHIGVEE